jgi:hypothetical protein
MHNYTRLIENIFKIYIEIIRIFKNISGKFSSNNFRKWNLCQNHKYQK